MAKVWSRLIPSQQSKLLGHRRLLLQISRAHKHHFILYHSKPKICVLGIPKVLISDNGPQFASQLFTDFATAYNIQHTTSSPHFAQSNGLAERTAQTVKRLLKESKDPYMAMLTYRSTPFPWCKLSPAELLMGICLRIPMLTTQLTPDWTFMEGF